MISGIVLTKNSPGVVKTLESLRWCDEIIVIDDYSSDNTLSLIKPYTAKVFQRHLDRDFAAQRNFALSKAKGPWAFFIDSDEVVTEELKDEILEKIRVSNLEDRNICGYYISRKDIMWGKELTHGETRNIKLLRLAKIDAGKWIRPVHEMWDVKGNVEQLIQPIFHYPHPDVAQFLSEINTYSGINAQYFYNQGVRVTFPDIVFYPLGKFLVNYFGKLGFLDGTAGIVMALMMSFHSFLTRGKIWELQKTEI